MNLLALFGSTQLRRDRLPLFRGPCDTRLLPLCGSFWGKAILRCLCNFVGGREAVKLTSRLQLLLVNHPAWKNIFWLFLNHKIGSPKVWWTPKFLEINLQLGFLIFDLFDVLLTLCKALLPNCFVNWWWRWGTSCAASRWCRWTWDKKQQDRLS